MNAVFAELAIAPILTGGDLNAGTRWPTRQDAGRDATVAGEWDEGPCVRSVAGATT
jgi:hypothetical protein